MLRRRPSRPRAYWTKLIAPPTPYDLERILGPRPWCLSVSPLHGCSASLTCSRQPVFLLVPTTADTTATSPRWGSSPARGRLPRVKALLQAGALVDGAKHAGYGRYFGLKGATALLAAARAGHADVLAVLLPVGACKQRQAHVRKVVVRGWSRESVHDGGQGAPSGRAAGTPLSRGLPAARADHLDPDVLPAPDWAVPGLGLAAGRRGPRCTREGGPLCSGQALLVNCHVLQLFSKLFGGSISRKGSCSSGMWRGFRNPEAEQWLATEYGSHGFWLRPSWPSWALR